MPIPCDGNDKQLEKLSAAMPAVCRCLNNDTEKAPDTPAKIVLNTLLAKSIDAIIRSANPLKNKCKKHDSLHDVWTAALTAENAQVMWADEQEIYSFSKQLTDWSRPVDLITRSPFKFCFRLSEPQEDEDKWRLD